METSFDFLPITRCTVGCALSPVARGGFEVDLAWEAGQLKAAQIHSLAGEPFVLVDGETQKKYHPDRGETVEISRNKK